MSNEKNSKLKNVKATKPWPSLDQQLINAKVFSGGKKKEDFGARYGSRLRMLALIVLILILAISGLAKMYEQPKSFSLKDKSQDQVQRKVLPRVDTQRLLEEDRIRDKDPRRPAPIRFAVPQSVAFTLGNSGTWQTLDDGRLWRLRIQSPEAKSLNLGITRFDMPEGAKLWIYDPEHKHVEGPYTSRHRSRKGTLWTPVIEGDEIVVEVFVPKGVSQPAIQISSVNHGYRSMDKVGEKGGLAGTEGTCNNDVICPAGDPWRNQIRAVGVYTINGSSVCSGTLLNNTTFDFRPFFLSANHCGVNSTNDDTVVVYWNFESATCGTHGPGSLADNQTGSTFRASSAPSDFLLFELSATPDPSFNVFYAGWDATSTTPPSTVGIHHPRGDVKAISLSNTAPQPADWTGTGDGGTLDPMGNHWRVDWDSGVTEGGSSGSCIFETSQGRCIGQLHGGPSACGLSSSSLHDYYGMLSVSWNGGGTAATRLRDWLDPLNTGTLSLDGDTHITNANGVHYDFQAAGEFVSLRDADGLEIQTRMTPVATTFDPGPDSYDGLATCVSINSAVAARVGRHRVTIQPNISGVPDPSGLQLRVDGVLTTLGPSGINFGSGSGVVKIGDGFQINFPNGTVLIVTPLFWTDQGKWYLNVDVFRNAADGMTGASPGGVGIAGGIMAAIAPDSWLPALPDGSSVGPMPAVLHQRYVTLYQKFGEAWRVTDKTSLFDYAPGASTATFTVSSWPSENPPCFLPASRPAKPLDVRIARRLCREVADKNMNANCVFDVTVTGEPGFAKLYLTKQRILIGSTVTTVNDFKDPTRVGERVTFTAAVARRKPGRGFPTGTVQFTIDGHNVAEPVRLDSGGRARWTTSDLKVGKHQVSASYIPARGSMFMASSSTEKVHTVKRENY